MKLVFSTNNKDKLFEVKRLIDSKIHLLSLDDIGFNEDIPETASTIEENASIKSNFIYNKYGIDCFADDTGLEVEALQGRPGVRSARYAGENKSSDDNINRILMEMAGVKNRNARFKTVISLIIDGKEILFEGLVNGSILETKRGTKGFGYDPIFQPENCTISFAEMSLDEKNKISHRAKAIRQLTQYLNKI
jgi:XTP/dITP diphosphohydrolase